MIKRLFLVACIAFTGGLLSRMPSSSAALMEHSCTATQLVVISAIAPDTAPTCTFSMFIDNSADVAFDVNGTGQVSGSMSFSEGALYTYFGQEEVDRQVPSACGPANFHCGYATASEGPNSGPYFYTGGLFRVTFTCRGGGIAVMETVSCWVNGE